jgi:hypothetical protein
VLELAQGSENSDAKKANRVKLVFDTIAMLLIAVALLGLVLVLYEWVGVS